MNQLSKKKIAIIGRGIAGLSAAFFLQEKGYKISLYGHHASKGSATWAACGVFLNKGLFLPRTDLFAAKLSGYKYLPTFIKLIEKKSGKKIPHSFSGAYELLESWQAYTSLKECIFHREPTGCFQADFLTKKEWIEHNLFVKKELKIKEEAVGCFFYPQDGSFDVEALVLALEACLEAAGGQFKAEKALGLAWSESKQQLEIKTSAAQTEFFDYVVLASGAGTADLLKPLVGKKVLFSQSRGHCLHGEFAEPKEQITLRLGKENFIVHEKKFWLSLKEQNVNTSILLSKSKLQALFKKTSNHLETKLELRSGLRCRSNKGAPLIGPLSSQDTFLSRIILFSAFHKSGLSLAPFYAQKLYKHLAKKQ